MADAVEFRNVAILGAGKMGTTLMSALLHGTGFQPRQIIATGRRPQTLRQIEEKYGVPTTHDNREAVADVDLILLCVKPQVVAQVLEEVSPALHRDQVLVSIAAGVSIRAIESRVPEEVAVIRAMPNTPSLVGAGMTALAGGTHAAMEQVEAARRLFEPMGRTAILEEVYFDAVTGVSASGPAFAYIIIEALAEGAVKVGLPRHTAIELSAQACLGAAAMVLETGKHPALLKDDVTTPAGCTVDGVLKLEEGGLRVTLIKAIEAAARRAGELVE